MCGRFSTTGKFSWREIHDALSTYGEVRTPPLNLEPNDDVRPTTAQAVARFTDGGWDVSLMRWGLVPFWRSGKPLKDTTKGAGDGFKLSTFNARVETCATAATFRDAYRRRRCIVPASAWYEWTGAPGAKVKHAFRRADDGLIWFAGLCDTAATPDAGPIDSFTILTGPSAGMLSDFHARAPVILEPSEFMAWLDPSNDPAEVIAAVRPERFVAQMP